MSVESSIKEKLKRIFGVNKVTFNLEGDAIEQDTLFVQAESSLGQIKDGLEVYRVSGQAFIYAQAEKFPIGFLPKRIKNADSNDTKDFFFYDLEGNSKVYQNLVQRSFSFIYFYSAEYDPELGEIEELDLTYEGDS